MQTHSIRPISPPLPAPLTSGILLGNSLLTGGPFLLTTLNSAPTGFHSPKILKLFSPSLNPWGLPGTLESDTGLRLGLFLQSSDYLGNLLCSMMTSSSLWDSESLLATQGLFQGIQGLLSDKNADRQTDQRRKGCVIETKGNTPEETKSHDGASFLRVPDLFTEMRHCVREAKQMMACEAQKLFQKTQNNLIEWIQGKWTLETGDTRQTLRGWFWVAAGSTLAGAGLILAAVMLHKKTP